jgi:HEAT repeat protein
LEGRDDVSHDEILAFLALHQPLGRDADVSQQTIDEFEEIVRQLLADPDVRCLKPLLGAIGDGDGLGVYAMVSDTLRAFPRDAVEEALVWGLASRHRSVRYWCAQFASEFPSASVVPHLLLLLDDRDRDTKYAALTALEQCRDPSAIPRLEVLARDDLDPEIRELASEVASDLERLVGV